MAVLFLLAGCGGDGDSRGKPAAEERTERSASADREAADRPPELPRGWKRSVNRAGGFSVGLPPGWRQQRRGSSSVLGSPDRLATLTIIADRSSGALELPLGDFAVRAAEALGAEDRGRQRLDRLRVGEARPFAHRYEAVTVRGRGRSPASDVPERVRVAVIRQPDVATYVAIVRANAKRRSPFADRRTIERMLRSIRGRPPG